MFASQICCQLLSTKHFAEAFQRLAEESLLHVTQCAAMSQALQAASSIEEGRKQAKACKRHLLSSAKQHTACSTDYGRVAGSQGSLSPHCHPQIPQEQPPITSTGVLDIYTCSRCSVPSIYVEKLCMNLTHNTEPQLLLCLRHSVTDWSRMPPVSVCNFHVNLQAHAVVCLLEKLGLHLTMTQYLQGFQFLRQVCHHAFAP